MLYSLPPQEQNPRRSGATKALPNTMRYIAPDATAPELIVPERSAEERKAYELCNIGGSAVFFKYVELGSDPTAVTGQTVLEDYDFVLYPRERAVDVDSTENAIVAITAAGQEGKIKPVEKLFIDIADDAAALIS